MTAPQPGSLYVVAELGHEHGGDFDLAIRMIGAAARAGVDAVVIDRFRAEGLAEPGRDGNYRRLKESELRPSQFRCLADLCQELGLDLVVHALDAESLDQSRDQATALWVSCSSLCWTQVLQMAADQSRPLFVETCVERLPDLTGQLPNVEGTTCGTPITLIQICERDEQLACHRGFSDVCGQRGWSKGVSDRLAGTRSRPAVSRIDAEVICRPLMAWPSRQESWRDAFDQLEQWVGAVRESGGDSGFQPTRHAA